METASRRRTDDSPSLCGRIVDYGIAAILFVAPLAMAGRYAGGRLLLLACIGVVATAWFLDRAYSQKRTSWVWTNAEWIGGIAVLLVLLQLASLSPFWMKQLAPFTSHIMPLWSQTGDGATWPVWSHVTVSTQATRGGLAMLLGYVFLFFVVVQRVRKKHEIQGLLKAVALAGVAMASLGLAQYIFGNGKFLWIFDHPSRDTLTAVKGTFANENHFAHFLALTLGPLLWWFVRSLDESEERTFKFGTATNPNVSRSQILLGLGLGIVLLASLLTYSRGGLLMVMLSAAVCTGLFAYLRKIGRKTVLAVSTVLLVSVIAVWIHGQELLTREITSIQSVSLESLDNGRSRRKIWSAVTEAIPHFALLGSGVGTHREIYPAFFNEPSTVIYTHAESGYLQVLLETGGPGLALLLCGIGLSGYWLTRSMISGKEEISMLAVPIIGAWCVSVVHAIADFNWFIPANMTVVIILVAAAARVSLLASTKAKVIHLHVPRLGWIVATAVVAICSIVSVQHYYGPARAAKHADEYLAWSLASNRFSRKSIGPGRQRSLGLVDGGSVDAVSWMTEQLHQSLTHDPNDGRAHVRMAAMCLRLFEIRQVDAENAMSLAQIRDAALSSGFETHAAMLEWISRAVGENRVLLDRALFHAKRGVYMSPLEGRGYLYLAEVAFLDEMLAVPELDLLSQAYAARPYDPAVQFMYGRQKMISGDAEGALVLWKAAFRRGVGIRKRVISALALYTSPQEIISLFQPDIDGLRDMFEFYRRNELVPQRQYVGEEYVAALEKQAKLLSGESAGELWFDAQFAHNVMGNTSAAAAAAVSSVKSQPDSYRNREACALRLRAAGHFKDALKEFRWCQQRRPDDATLQAVVMDLKRVVRESEAAVSAVPRDPRR